MNYISDYDNGFDDAINILKARNTKIKNGGYPDEFKAGFEAALKELEEWQ